MDGDDHNLENGITRPMASDLETGTTYMLPPLYFQNTSSGSPIVPSQTHNQGSGLPLHSATQISPSKAGAVAPLLNVDPTSGASSSFLNHSRTLTQPPAHNHAAAANPPYNTNFGTPSPFLRPSRTTTPVGPVPGFHASNTNPAVLSSQPSATPSLFLLPSRTTTPVGQGPGFHASNASPAFGSGPSALFSQPSATPSPFLLPSRTTIPVGPGPGPGFHASNINPAFGSGPSASYSQPSPTVQTGARPIDSDSSFASRQIYVVDGSGTLVPVDNSLLLTEGFNIGVLGDTEPQPLYGENDEYVLSKLRQVIDVSKDIKESQNELESRMRSIEEKNDHIRKVLRDVEAEAEQERTKRKRGCDEKSYDPVKVRKLKKDLDDMLGTSKLDLAIKEFSLPSDITKKNFKTAVQAELLMLLQVDGITRRYFDKYPEPSREIVQKYSESNKTVDFLTAKKYCYSLNAPFDHPFNIAARDAFPTHFALTLVKTNWLYKFPFDRRLVIPEVILEVLRIILLRAKRAWDNRRTFVKPSSDVKRQKRVDSRRHTVRKRRGEACKATESPNLRRQLAFIESATEEGLDIHSGDESDGGNDPEVFDYPHQKMASHKLLDWRSRSLTLLLWGLEISAKELDKKRVEDNDGISKGNAYRIRQPHLQIASTRRVPTTLPINCYSKKFIRSLESWETKLLEPKAPLEFGNLDVVSPFSLDENEATILNSLLDELEDADSSDLGRAELDKSSMEIDEE